jgi:MscS family membrane protein
MEDEMGGLWQTAKTEGAAFWAMVEDVWETGAFGVAVGDVLIILGILVLALAFRQIFARVVMANLARLARKTSMSFDDQAVAALESPLKAVPVVFGLYLALAYIPLEGDAEAFATNLLESLVAAIIFWGFYNLVDPFSVFLHKAERVLTAALIDWIIKALKVAFVLIGAAAVLESWEISVAPIIASLGILGVAIALGAQDLMRNLIAGLLILVEKRFNKGDWVLVDGVCEGTVEKIGFRSTLVRRFDKALVQVPNTALSDNAVTNFTAMTYRRIYWAIGVEYRTSKDQLAEIRGGIEQWILAHPGFAKPPEVPTFVRIDSFGASSIDIMVYCFTVSTVWGDWLKLKEELAFAIKDIVEKAGTGFAFPSRSLYVETVPSQAPEPFSPPPEERRGTAGTEETGGDRAEARRERADADAAAAALAARRAGR